MSVSLFTQVICLQSFARRWLAQQEVDRLRKERSRRLAWLELQERRRKEEKEEQLRDRRQRWMNPQSKEDFNLLYHALESRFKTEEKGPQPPLCCKSENSAKSIFC